MNQTIKTAAILLAAMGMGYLGGLLSQTTHKATAAETHAGPSKVITAQRFQLVDSAGKERGEFSLDKYGTPSLDMLDSDGKIRGSFGMAFGDNPNSFPCLSLHDSTGKAGWQCSVIGDSPSLFMMDSTGQVRGEFSTGDHGPHLTLYDSAGTAREMVMLNHDNPGLMLCDEAGKVRGMISLFDDTPVFGSIDKAGKITLISPH